MTTMFGADIQCSRTMLTLVEESSGSISTSCVGDGQRSMVPNVVRPLTSSSATSTREHKLLWGSGAVDPTADRLQVDRVDSMSSLREWRTNPWTADFASGMTERIASYLGDYGSAQDYHLSAGLASNDEVGSARRTLLASGAPSAALVHPCDAVLCRWLAEPALPLVFRGTVITVASGESSTMVNAYRVERGERNLSIQGVPGADGYVASGSGIWCDDLGRLVLSRSSDSAMTCSAVELLDGVMEFASLLRYADQADKELTWRGLLADHLYTSVRLSARSMGGWDSVASTVQEVRAAVSASMRSAGDPKVSVIVCSGIGAVWPFWRSALSDLGEMWQSGSPERDVALGAALWPVLQDRFIEPATLRLAGESTAVELELAPQPVSTLEEMFESPIAELPPWKRRGHREL